MIFFLHGYGSNIKNNLSKMEELENIFEKDVIGLDYDSEDDPFKISEKLYNEVEPYLFSENLFIGNSLGGFWAEYLANLLLDNCAIFNPCFKPSIFLKQFSSNKNIDKYTFLEYKKKCPKYVFIADKDEIIDSVSSKEYYKDRSKIIEFNGTHRIQSFKQFRKELLEINENVQLWN